MLHECFQYAGLSDLIERLTSAEEPVPKIIEIHPTDLCNNRCEYCFHNGKGYEKKRKDEILSLEEYSLLFDEMFNLKILHLSIAGGGEPFCDRRMLNILKSAHEKKLETRIVTNGNLLNPKLMSEILRAKEIRFSVDTINPETYVRIRDVDEKLLLKTLKNIKNLVNLRNSEKSLLNIGASMLITDKNYTEIDEFCEYMLSIGVDAVVLKQDVYGRYKHNISETEKIRNNRIELKKKCDLDVTGMRCFVPYFKVAFNPYGDLYSCCLGSQPFEKNGFLFGNLHHKSFSELWEHSKNTRKTMRQRGVSCEHCNSTDYDINKKIGYITIQTKSNQRGIL